MNEENYTIIEKISLAVQAGDALETVSLVEKAVADGNKAQDIIDNGLKVGIEELDRKFQGMKAFIPEILVGARAFNKGTIALKSIVSDDDIDKPLGKVVAATVSGDLHDIGKTLVCIMLEGAGFDVVDLGVDVPASEIIEAIKNEKPDILALSMLISTSMGVARDVIGQLIKAGVRDNVCVMIGGDPINQEFCDSIGADYYAENAFEVPPIAKKVMAKKPEVKVKSK